MTTGVSVLIATNRQNSWLDEALASLLNQTHEAIEIVLVLDGIKLAPSTPWLTAPNLVLVEVPHSRGLAAALNTAAAHASYDLFARLDADDLAEPERISLQARQFQQRATLVLLGTAALTIDSRGLVRGNRSVEVGVGVAAGLLWRNQFVHPSVMMRRSAFERVGGYAEECRQMEDYELWLRLACVGEVDNLRQPLTRYRIHDKQMSHRAGALGPHIRAVMRARKSLSNARGRKAIVRIMSDTLWRAAQWIRHLRWVLSRVAGFGR